MSLTIRKDLGNIPAYVPGKRRDDALKLSSNETTLPPLEHAVAAMAEAVAGVNRYPDMSVDGLKKALAAHLKVSYDQVTCGCGSSALCQQLVQATCRPGDEVIFAWRSFEAYPIFAMVTGATPVTVPLTKEHTHDLAAMAAAVTEKTKLIFVCNPNNPTGTTVTKKQFTDFMAAIPDHVVVALDEAYFEYVRDTDTPVATEEIKKYPNLVGLRTFSKAYGLAGLRVGYAFGNPEIISAMEKCSLPFGVNSIAQAGAVASLEATDELLARTEDTVVERTRVAEAIGAVPSQANFVWYPATTPEEAKKVADSLAAQGVLVRCFPEGVRITVTVAPESTTLLDAWDKVGK
ncbi:histidinol-phosphate transaminase [Corynebacterium mendelii]|uniref:Aromatic amino acid aminotransferase n=1 Tax=Corynebacterium mendelii TaxID=2765362 RepID=A0A939E0Y9_9CORY|nr:histidinol-phosphate transaminase [Corynebacterium mendelii]MBN9643711.1 histidinol-phosphate transaminase [Corynebacterium mendelii]